MDTTAYLTAQGWRGNGHSLDADNRGLAKPLLTSRKADVLGIGKKKHDLADQWWLRAFDSTLRALDTSKKGEVKLRDDAGLQKLRGGLTPLYRCFVQGESLRGTISPEAEVAVVPGAGGKRKREGETADERRERRAERKTKRGRRGAGGDETDEKLGQMPIGSAMASESGAVTPMASAGLSQMDACLEEPFQPTTSAMTRVKKSKRKPTPTEAPAAPAAIRDASMTIKAAKETSEERRERKEAKKLRKLERASKVELAPKEERKKKKKKSA